MKPAAGTSHLRSRRRMAPGDRPAVARGPLASSVGYGAAGSEPWRRSRFRLGRTRSLSRAFAAADQVQPDCLARLRLKRQSIFECSEQCKLIRVQHRQSVVLKIGADADQLRGQPFEFHGQHADQVRIGRILLLGLPKFLLLGSSFLDHWLRGFADLSMNFPQSPQVETRTDRDSRSRLRGLRSDRWGPERLPSPGTGRAVHAMVDILRMCFLRLLCGFSLFLFYEYPGRSVVIGNPVLSGKLRPSRMYREIEHERGMVPDEGFRLATKGRDVD